ncbi:MAG: anthranilate phosphoribosyltransferase [Maricaulaceae bacterium]
MSIPADIFKTLASGGRLSAEELTDSLTTILEGGSNDAQIAALLMALETQGYSAVEIQAGTAVMRKHMVPVSIDADVIDIVGTGGTGLHTLSISTATAIVTAGAGAKVAKHGNRAASSLTGTADTLSQLGVNLAISPEKASECVMQAGLGFLFAPNHHPAMRHVGPARKALGIRTLFNVLGPLCNPAGAKRQLLGVCEKSWQRPIAEALADLGSTHIWVVHGRDGMDEITTTDATDIIEVKNGELNTFTLSPSDFNIPQASMENLRGGHPADNAKALTELLDGKTSPYRDIVRLNSAAALLIAGKVDTIENGLDMAKASIDSGAAKAVLAKLVEISNA